MEFKRFKRKGLIFNNNSIGLGLELRIGKKIKVFRIERLTKDDKTFDFLIYDGPKVIEGSLKKEIVEFLEKRDDNCSFFEGESKVWEKIKG
tara:strand:- start:3252 stop:3524 length:273 start_codon:yes stop_codon:yes gene_type:complete